MSWSARMASTSRARVRAEGVPRNAWCDVDLQVRGGLIWFMYRQGSGRRCILQKWHVHHLWMVDADSVCRL